MCCFYEIFVMELLKIEIVKLRKILTVCSEVYSWNMKCIFSLYLPSETNIGAEPTKVESAPSGGDGLSKVGKF